MLIRIFSDQLTKFFVSLLASKKCLNCDNDNLVPNLLCYSCWSGLKLKSTVNSYGDLEYVFSLENQGKDLIYKNKYGKVNYINQVFLRLLISKFGKIISDYDLLTIVPYNYQKLSKKGYNNNAILAHKLGKKYGKKVLPNLLIKKYSKDQVGLNYIERQKNAQKIYSLNQVQQANIVGKKIILLDDVITTSATLNICKNLLYNGGAAKIFCIALAHTPKNIA